MKLDRPAAAPERVRREQPQGYRRAATARAELLACSAPSRQTTQGRSPGSGASSDSFRHSLRLHANSPLAHREMRMVSTVAYRGAGCDSVGSMWPSGSSTARKAHRCQCGQRSAPQGVAPCRRGSIETPSDARRQIATDHRRRSHGHHSSRNLCASGNGISASSPGGLYRVVGSSTNLLCRREIRRLRDDHSRGSFLSGAYR